MLFDFLSKPISRRQAIRTSAYGAALAGLFATLSGCKKSGDAKNAGVESSVKGIDILKTYKETKLTLEEKHSWKLPLGVVLKPSQGIWIAALAHGDVPTNMTKGCAFNSATGQLADVVTDCVTDGQNWVVYDTACSDLVYVWVELNMLTYSWKLYGAAFDDGKIKQTNTLWESDKNFDPPSIACTGSKVFWQVMPSKTGKKTAENSACYLWKTGDSKARAVVTSQGRFGTPVALSGEYAVLTPRVTGKKDGIHYGITAYSLRDDLSSQVAQLVLPAAVKPMYATYIQDNFVFSIEAKYDAKGLLGTMGTFIGKGSGPYAYLSREPYAHVTGNGLGIFIIKSRSSYFVVNMNDKTYSMLPSKDRCVDYGEYPGVSGQNSTFVTFSTIKSEDTGYPSQVIVRSFSI